MRELLQRLFATALPAARRPRPVHHRAASPGGTGASVWPALGSRSSSGRPRSGRPPSPSRWPRIWPIEVVSRPIRGRSIGGSTSARPSRRAASESACPHHGLDLVEPGERYSAGRFARGCGRLDRRASGAVAACRWSSEAPGSTSGRWSTASFGSRRSTPTRRARAAGLDRDSARQRAGPLGRPARPGVPWGRPPARHPRHRDGAAHRAPLSHWQRAARAQGLIEPVVRRADGAAAGPAPAHPAAGGRDAASRADRGGGRRARRRACRRRHRGSMRVGVARGGRSISTGARRASRWRRRSRRQRASMPSARKRGSVISCAARC